MPGILLVVYLRLVYDTGSVTHMTGIKYIFLR